MKKILWNITLASAATLAAYIGLYIVWGAILNDVENETLKLFLICLMTSAACGFFLLYFLKIRNSDGEKEVLADYKECAYKSFFDDLTRILRREAKTLISLAAIVMLCFAVNAITELITQKPTGSPLTFIYVSLCIFSAILGESFIGYFLSAVITCLCYLIALLLWRRKTYNYWMKNKS